MSDGPAIHARVPRRIRADWGAGFEPGQPGSISGPVVESPTDTDQMSTMSLWFCSFRRCANRANSRNCSVRGEHPHPEAGRDAPRARSRIGNKELREYMEVRGYADASEWVYGQALAPDRADTRRTLTVTEIRDVHRAAMARVWDVAPHPGASDREGPGSFREHEIHPFPGGMEPVSWVLVPAEIATWARRRQRTGGALCGPSRTAGGTSRSIRADPPVHRRQRTYGTTPAQPGSGSPRLPACDRLQATALRLPAGTSSRRLR